MTASAPPPQTRRERRVAAARAESPAERPEVPVVPPTFEPVAAPQAEEGAQPASVPPPRARLRAQADRWRERIDDATPRVVAAVRTVTDVIRPLGWALLAITAVLWTLTLVFGWEEAMIAAVVVTVILVLCIPFLFGRTAYDIDLDLTRTHVVVGERAVGGLTLGNSTTRSLLPSRVVLPVGAGRGVFDVPRLAPGAVHEELFAIPTHARGVLQVGPVSVQRGDPLGALERTHDRRQAAELYVHPRTTALDGLSLGHMRDLEGLPVQQLSRDDVSFHALREYQPGDDLRHVHWKSTARVGTVMVRQYEETRRSHFVVGLSTSSGDYREPDEFELAISAAGSIGVRAIRDSRALQVRVPAGALRAMSSRRFLDALSELEFTRPRAGGIVEVAGSLSMHAPDAAVAVLVCGSAVAAADLQLACSRLPYELRVLAIVADLTVTSPELRRVGNADVVTLGSLDQLPLAVRKVLS